MKVLHQSTDALELGERPWFIPLVCAAMGITFVMKAVTTWPTLSGGARAVSVCVVPICFFMAWISASSTRLRLDRTAAVMRWTRRFGLGLRTRSGEFALDEFRGAIVETLDDGDGPSYRVALRFGDEQFHITEAYGAKEPAERLCHTINQWRTG
jgi:hypothetical protein